MADYSIGQMERLTGIKAHVLRYWEEAIPLIRPRKDDVGRRFYSARDLELINRVKFLVQEKKYTLEGAGQRLMAELSDNSLNELRFTMSKIREELARVYTLAAKWKETGTEDETYTK